MHSNITYSTQQQTRGWPEGCHHIDLPYVTATYKTLPHCFQSFNKQCEQPEIPFFALWIRFPKTAIFRNQPICNNNENVSCPP